MALLALSIFAVPPAAADTARTGWKPLTVPAGVEVNCTLTINKDETVDMSCSFRNTNAVAKKFLFCAMIDLQQKHQPAKAGDSPKLMPVPRTYDLELVGGVWKCTDKGEYRNQPNSWHFGCRLVELPAANGATVTVTFDGGSTPFKKPANLKSLRADQFQVTYADTVNLAGTANTYNAASCNVVNGQGNFLVPRGKAATYWVTGKQPFIDPFIVWEDLTGTLGPIEYALIDNMPCLPAGAPPGTAGFPACPPGMGPAPPMVVDVNLYNQVTYAAPAGTVFPVYHTVTIDGDMDGLRLETTPPPDTPYVIPGWVAFYGSIAFCSDATVVACLAPTDVEEGRVIQYTVNVHNATTDEFMFSQVGTFVQDTVPPIVTSHSFGLSGSTLLASVTVQDALTSPTSAEVWYSADGGPWIREDLATASDPFDDTLLTRTFSGSVAFPPSSHVRFFVSSHDEVYNVNYFGIAEVDVPASSAVPALGPIGFVLAAAALAVGSVVVLRTRAALETVA